MDRQTDGQADVVKYVLWIFSVTLSSWVRWRQVSCRCWRGCGDKRTFCHAWSAGLQIFRTVGKLGRVPLLESFSPVLSLISLLDVASTPTVVIFVCLDWTFKPNSSKYLIKTTLKASPSTSTYNQAEIPIRYSNREFLCSSWLWVVKINPLRRSTCKQITKASWDRNKLYYNTHTHTNVRIRESSDIRRQYACVRGLHNFFGLMQIFVLERVFVFDNVIAGCTCLQQLNF